MEPDTSEFTVSKVLTVYGKNIKKYRERKGLSLKSLANRATYDRGSLRRVEAGKLNIEFSTAVKLARALDVSFPSLFKDSENGNESSGKFQENDYLRIFRDNFQKLSKSRMVPQSTMGIEVDLHDSVMSRLIHGKLYNPTLGTLYKHAYAVKEEMETMFLRTEMEKKE